MHIDSKDTICNIPIVKVRNALRGVHTSFSNGYLVDYLKVNTKQAHDTINELKNRDYITKYEDKFLKRQTKRVYWEMTIKGNAFRMASAAPPISRKIADKKISEFIDRVREINSNKNYAHGISIVVIFGSYLESKKDFINDIDIAIQMVRRTTDPDKFHELCEKRTNEAEKNGRHFNNIAEHVFWPSTEIRYYLKNRSRAYSMHTFDEVIDFIKNQEHFSFKVIYKLKGLNEITPDYIINHPDFIRSFTNNGLPVLSDSISFEVIEKLRKEF
jgi:predicted nucleotidyltransferase